VLWDEDMDGVWEEDIESVIDGVADVVPLDAESVVERPHDVRRLMTASAGARTITRGRNLVDMATGVPGGVP
jgi:hypothetical protein